MLLTHSRHPIAHPKRVNYGVSAVSSLKIILLPHIHSLLYWEKTTYGETASVLGFFRDWGAETNFYRSIYQRSCWLAVIMVTEEDIIHCSNARLGVNSAWPWKPYYSILDRMGKSYFRVCGVCGSGYSQEDDICNILI